MSRENCPQTAPPSPSNRPNLGHINAQSSLLLCCVIVKVSLTLTFTTSANPQVLVHTPCRSHGSYSPSYSGQWHPYSAHLDGEDKIIALRPLLKGLAETPICLSSVLLSGLFDADGIMVVPTHSRWLFQNLHQQVNFSGTQPNPTISTQTRTHTTKSNMDIHKASKRG